MGEQQRRDFLRRIVPAIPRLAVEQFDLGCFTDERYVHEIVVDNLVPIQQPPLRMTAQQERWVEDCWLAEQLGKGLVRKAGPYEQCPVVTSLLLVPGG